MNLPRYTLKAEKSLMIFEFISEGPNGTILKLIKYDETNLKDVFNLAFGDKNIHTGEINDTAVSNNGDSDKILATVVDTIFAITDKHPDAYIYATGSTRARTRLYRMGITQYLDEIKQDFTIYGQRNGEWELFTKRVEYDAFLAQRKKQ